MSVFENNSQRVIKVYHQTNTQLAMGKRDMNMTSVSMCANQIRNIPITRTDALPLVLGHVVAGILCT